MRLPADNSLTLDNANTLCVDDGSLVAMSDAEVLMLCPAWVRAASSVVRDGVLRALRRYWLAVQRAVGAAFAAVQSPRSADGLRLDAHGERRKRPRVPHESDASYRARLLVNPRVITPEAITVAVAELVRATMPVDPVVFEPAMEGFFIQSETDVEAGTAAWSCFVQSEEGALLWAEMPDNPVRAGVWVSDEPVTQPLFVVLVDGAAMGADDTCFALPEGSVVQSAYDYWGAEGAPFGGYVSSADVPLLDSVVREVELRRAAGVLWWLHVVPNLRGAL